MKIGFVLFAAILSMQSLASTEEFAQVQVKWNSNTLYESVVMMCDDTYYAGIELEIEGDYTSYDGKVTPESYITLKDCEAGLKITKKQVVVKNGKAVTKIRLRNAGECRLEIRRKTMYPNSPKKFTLDVTGAC